MIYSDYLTIIFEDKIYSQRTPTSKFVEFDIRGTKIDSYEELPIEIKDIVNINKEIEEHPSNFLEYEMVKTGWKITRIHSSAGTHIKIPQLIDNIPVVELGSNIFEGIFHQPEQVMLPDTIERFYEQTFKYADRLRHVNIPPMVTEIPALCFYGCYKINNLNLSNITKIGSNAFEDCMSLTSANLSNAETIQNSAFTQCSALKKVTFSDKLTFLGTHAFVSCSELNNIELPDSLHILEERTFERCYSLEKIKLPKDLLSIEGNCFKNCFNLISFDAPESLEVIKSSAFYSAGIESVHLNEKLKAIGPMAFAKCGNIKNIYIYSTTNYEHSSFPFDSYDKIRTIYTEKPKYNYKER